MDNSMEPPCENPGRVQSVRWGSAIPAAPHSDGALGKAAQWAGKMGCGGSQRPTGHPASPAENQTH